MRILRKKLRFKQKMTLSIIVGGAVLIGSIRCIRIACPPSRDNSVANYPFPIYPTANEFDKKASFLEGRLKKNSNSFLDWAELASTYLKQGKDTGDNGRVDEAEKFAQRSLASFSDKNSRAQLILADIAETRHEFRSAIELSKATLAKDARAIGALATIVTSSLALGDHDEARKAADRLVELSPDTGSYTLRALVWAAHGNDAAALYYFKKAIALEDIGGQGGSAWVRALMARHYLGRGEYPLAKEYLDESLRLAPKQALSLGLAAELARAQNRLNEAKQLYAAAFQAVGAPLFLVHQGSILKEQGDITGANAIWDQAEKLIRQDMKSRYGHPNDLIVLQLERKREGDLKEALSLAAAETKRRGDAPTIFNFAQALYENKRYEEAWTTLHQLLWSGAKEAAYFYQAGLIRSALNDKPQARFFFEQALSTNPRFEKAQAALK